MYSHFQIKWVITSTLCELLAILSSSHCHHIIVIGQHLATCNSSLVELLCAQNWVDWHCSFITQYLSWGVLTQLVSKSCMKGGNRVDCTAQVRAHGANWVDTSCTLHHGQDRRPIACYCWGSDAGKVILMWSFCMCITGSGHECSKNSIGVTPTKNANIMTSPGKMGMSWCHLFTQKQVTTSIFVA